MTDERGDEGGKRKADAFSEWKYLYGDSFQRDALDEEALKKGFMAGFVRGQLTDGSVHLQSQVYSRT